MKNDKHHFYSEKPALLRYANNPILFSNLVSLMRGVILGMYLSNYIDRWEWMGTMNELNYMLEKSDV